MRHKKLTPAQVRKIIELRGLTEPVTVTNLARRFSVSERTVYYILANYRAAEASLQLSVLIANGDEEDPGFV